MESPSLITFPIVIFSPPSYALAGSTAPTNLTL
jgi:hypothetical protein